MLVLTRKNGESILIGSDIEVRVLRIDGGQVRIGIKAPVNVNIVRSELRMGEHLADGAADRDCSASDVV